MNCKDYKEAIAADPSEAFDGATHAAACESCAAFRDEMQLLDKKIAKAMDISVPELSLPELPAIGEDDGNVVNLPFRGNRKTTFTWVGLAASLVLVTVLGARFLAEDVPQLTLAEEIMAHLDHEPYALAVTYEPVSDQLLDAVFRDEVEELDRGVGIFTYAASCVIKGNTIPHLVIQGKQGPITLLLLPDEMVDSVMPIEGASVRGVILPVGQGSIAIIGERDEPLEEVRQRLSNSVKWRT